MTLYRCEDRLQVWIIFFPIRVSRKCRENIIITIIELNAARDCISLPTIGFRVYSRERYIFFHIDLPELVLIESILETRAVRREESQILCRECSEEMLHTHGEVMPWITIDRRSVQIHEEILQSECLHTFDGFFSIGIVDIVFESHDETVIEIARTILRYEVCHEGSDPVDLSRVFRLVRRVENTLIESLPHILYILYDCWIRGRDGLSNKILYETMHILECVKCS